MRNLRIEDRRVRAGRGPGWPRRIRDELEQEPKQAAPPGAAEGTKVIRRTVHAKSRPGAAGCRPPGTGGRAGEARSRHRAGLHRLQRLRVRSLGIEQQPAGQHRQQRLVGRRLEPAARLDRARAAAAVAAAASEGGGGGEHERATTEPVRAETLPEALTRSSTGACGYSEHCAQARTIKEQIR